jgi:lipoprotein NlpD
MALVRCFAIFAVLCIFCTAGCIRKQPPSSPSTENQEVSNATEEDVPTYILNTGPDVEVEPPSPFFTRHRDDDNEADTETSIPIAAADTRLFSQPSPFDSRGEKVVAARKLDLAIQNGVESAEGKAVQSESEASSPRESNVKPLFPSDETDETLDFSIESDETTVPSQGKAYTMTGPRSVNDTMAAPVSISSAVEKISYINNVPLDEAFPRQDHVSAVYEDPVLERPTSHTVLAGETIWGIANRFKISTRQLIAANRGVNDANVIAVGARLLIPPVDYDPSRTFVVEGSDSSASVSHYNGGSSIPPLVNSVSKPSYAQQPLPPHKKEQPKSKDVASTSSAKVTPSSMSKDVKVHVLQPGETLWSVAREYRLSVTDLMLLNRLSEASSLRAGREILVPAVNDSETEVSPASGSRMASSRGGNSKNGATQYKVAKGDTLWKISKEFSVTVAEIIQWNKDQNLDRLNVGMSLNVSPPGGSSSFPVASRTYSSTVSNGMSSSSGISKEAPVRAPVPSLAPVPTRVSQATVEGNVAFSWPIRGEIIKSFGWYDGKPHTGIDIKGAVGDKARAAASGHVIFAGPMRGYGNVVIVDHRNGHFTVYGNLLEVLVKKGTAKQPVVIKSGAYIGRIGAVVEGPVPCLHFEMRIKNKAIDPMKYLGF